jgi:hypothetical protein
VGAWCGPGTRGDFLGESSPAEGQFSGVLGTAHVSRADLPNMRITKNLGWAENCWVGPTYQASLPGRAERPFSVQLGSARIRKPGYQTSKFLKISVGKKNGGLNQATKHTLRKPRKPTKPLDFHHRVKPQIITLR